MGTNPKTPQARPLFRKLALGMAVVLFVLATAFRLAPIGRDNKLLGGGVCLFVGFVMLNIGKTGRWPPRGSR
jgi:hypothetical protein